MNCSMCGILLEENLSFCGKCGMKLPKDDVSISIKKKLYIDKNDGFKKGLIKVAKLDFIALVLFMIDNFILYEFQDLYPIVSFVAIVGIILVPIISLAFYRGQRLGILLAWIVTIFFVIPAFIAISMLADNLRGLDDNFSDPPIFSEDYSET